MEPLLSMDAAIAVLTGSPSSGNTITPAETVAETPTVSGPAVEKEKQETTGEESIDNPKAPKGRWPRRTADSYSNIGGKSKNKKARKTFAAKNDEPEVNAPYGVVLESFHTHPDSSNPILESRKTGPCIRVRFDHLSLAIMPDGDDVSIQYKRPNTALNVFRSMSKKEAVKSVVTIASSREFPHEISLVMKAKGFPPSAVERTDLVDKSITGKKALKRELLYYLEFV